MFASRNCTKRGEGRRKADALQGRQRRVGQFPPVRIKDFFQKLVLYLSDAKEPQDHRSDFLYGEGDAEDGKHRYYCEHL